MTVPEVKPKVLKKTNTTTKKTKAKKPITDAVVIAGLGKMEPVTVGVDAPKLKSALAPKLMKGKGVVEEKSCKVCDCQIMRDNGAENDTLLNKHTPRIRSGYIPL
jgi:hypothetical protein